MTTSRRAFLSSLGIAGFSRAADVKKRPNLLLILADDLEKKVARGPLFWEHEGSHAVRDGKWKLTAVGAEEDWELYDMENDRTELENLAQAQPARVKKMAAQWEQWARRTNVLPWIWKPQYGETANRGGVQ